MMKVVFSSHALLELTLREIDKSDVELTIAEPDKTVEGRHGQENLSENHSRRASFEAYALSSCC
jgi:hypothetical protein